MKFSFRVSMNFENTSQQGLLVTSDNIPCRPQDYEMKPHQFLTHKPSKRSWTSVVVTYSELWDGFCLAGWNTLASSKEGLWLGKNPCLWFCSDFTLPCQDAQRNSLSFHNHCPLWKECLLHFRPLPHSLCKGSTGLALFCWGFFFYLSLREMIYKLLCSIAGTVL